jgi:hypothetical protein
MKRAEVVFGLMFAASILACLFLFVSLLHARDAVQVAQQNAEAALDVSRVLSDSLDTLNGRQAAERLALQTEVEEKDAAVIERERQLNATTVALSRIRLERDSFAIVMAQVDTNDAPAGVATWAADTAGIHAEVDVRPAPDSATRVDLRIRFEPVEVLQAFMRDDQGRVSLLAIADSIHRPTVVAAPIFEPPSTRGFFDWSLRLAPVLVTGLGCGAAAGMAHLLGSSGAEAGVIGGSCIGAIFAFKLIL